MLTVTRRTAKDTAVNLVKVSPMPLECVELV